MVGEPAGREPEFPSDGDRSPALRRAWGQVPPPDPMDAAVSSPGGTTPGATPSRGRWNGGPGFARFVEIPGTR